MIVRRLLVLAALLTGSGVSELADAYCAGGGGAPGDTESLTVMLVDGAASCGQIAGPGPHTCGPPSTSDRAGVTLSVTATCWTSATVSFSNGGTVQMNGTGGGTFGLLVGAYDVGGTTPVTTLALDPSGLTSTTFAVFPDQTQGVTHATPSDSYTGTVDVIVSTGP